MDDSEFFQTVLVDAPLPAGPAGAAALGAGRRRTGARAGVAKLMPQATILFFGSVGDLFGRQRQVEIPPDCSVADLRRMLATGA